ncbi:MAG TPA: peptide deformylase [Gemmatimonadota bacterium]|nr:peptide deformylase [Gemmatimonadota bacterium]
MIRDIRLLGDPILRRKTVPVERFDAELASFLEDLLETMYDAEGVGLAAPQVGDPRRVTVIDISEERDGSQVLELVNPRILRSEGTVASEEGCLSIPGMVETIERAAEVEVEYEDRLGERRVVAGTELLSRALQHEIDHLEGILFIDYLGTLKRRMVVREWRRTMAEQGIEVAE